MNIGDTSTSRTQGYIAAFSCKYQLIAVTLPVEEAGPAPGCKCTPVVL